MMSSHPCFVALSRVLIVCTAPAIPNMRWPFQPHNTGFFCWYYFPPGWGEGVGGWAQGASKEPICFAWQSFRHLDNDTAPRAHTELDVISKLSATHLITCRHPVLTVSPPARLPPDIFLASVFPYVT